MKNGVLPLKNKTAQKAAHSGSKGAMLARMIGAGLPVPNGFVVTTHVFKTVVANLFEVVKLRKINPANKGALEQASAKARMAILSCPLPEVVEQEIYQAFKKLHASAVSVRSSSTAEDLEVASFAGQYDSFLNVHTPQDLLARIKDVWISLYSPHAVVYRHRHKIPFEKASMAVVVQKQLTPEASGVLFTKDPVTGKNQYVVTVALGLGEGVVAGTAETDRFVLDPQTGQTLQADIVAKTMRVITTPTGGIDTEIVPEDLGQAPALTTQQLKVLSQIGRTLVRLYKTPQDIEFAITDGEIQLLQTRAMTALVEEAVPDTPWDAGINKRFTYQRRRGPCFRLEEDYLKEHAAQMGVCYEETGSSMTEAHLPHFANGYLFMRAKPHNKKILTQLHARQTRCVNASLRKGKSYFEDVLQGMIEKHLSELKKQRSSAKTLCDLVDYLEACLKMAAWVQGNLHWRQGKPGGRPDWTKTFHELTGEPPLKSHTCTMAVQNRMTRLIDRIRGLARIAQQDRVLKQVMITRRFQDLESPRIKCRKAGDLFWKKFKSMLYVYGQRNGAGYGASNSFTTPTWNMAWSIPFEIIASYVEEDLDRIDQMEKQARAERSREIRRIRRTLAPKKLKQFNASLYQAIQGVRFLENHNYYMEQCSIGTMREAIHDVGKTLVHLDVIAHPDDVVHLSLAELKKIACEKTHIELRALIREREQELAVRKKMKPPQTIGKQPRPGKKAPSEEEKRGLEGNLIRGAAASAGRHRGPACVIDPAKPHPKVHPGDVLVAPNVGPDWTPLFAIIGGLVLDSGSLGQHAALVAREYRIPAVMMTKEASKVIKTGQIITVDGNQGIVELGS